MSINWQEIAFHFLGGLGLFLYSIKTMGDGLQQAAGDRLRYYIDKYTSNPFFGILVGIGMTALIQSSSGVTVITVGLVSAGLLTLRQAIGIVMGANIGTTVTSFIIGFKLGDYALPMLFLGAVCLFFTKNRTINNIGRIVFGVGGIFFALNLMSGAMEPLKDLQVFKDYMVELSKNPILGVLVGTGLTLLIQASSATIGILQNLYASHLIDLQGALPVLFGDNIGTCTTALISSLGTSRRGKQVALFHLMINIIGTIYFMLFLRGILVNVVESIDPGNVARQIANAHTIFNIVNVIVLFPFTNLLVKLIQVIIPDSEDEEESITRYLDKRILVTPSIALENTMYEFAAMAQETIQALDNAVGAARNRDKKLVKKALENEKNINAYEKAIVKYLVEISQQKVSAKDQQTIDELFSTANDIERIGDHAENIADFAKSIIEREIFLDEDTVKELDGIYELIKRGFALSIDALSTGDQEKVQQAIQIERDIDKLKIEVRDKYMKRMNKGIASAESGIFVMDLLSNLERVSDHFINIAETVERLKRPVIVTE